ncbi:MAG: NAD(P)/FAD-dependent oxidoreductase [Candidatus Adlerbacteria bacterium]
MNADVVIVGAGAAGLMAARELARAGKKIIILEARDRIGGRIYPLSESDFGYEAMGGAEFIHGKAPVTKALAQELGLTLTHPTEWWNVRDGEPTKVAGAAPHDPQLEQKLRELTEDISVEEFLKKNFPKDTHAALWDFVCRWTEGYDAADIARASTFGLREEMLDSSTWMQMNIKEGYGPILRYLQQEAETHKVEFHFNTCVTSIDHTSSVVKVTTANGVEYKADKVILTVPLPLVSQISYTPAIPEKLAAVEKMGYGAVIKMLLRFKTKWWTGVREQIFERLFFMLSSEKVPTWWTQYPEERPVLTGWLPGPQALEMSKLSDEQILDAALQSLSNIFKISLSELKEQLTNYKIINWPADPYAQGVYSYATPWSEEGIAELRKPVANKLYFAGEALTQGHDNGTVEAALASGKETAEKILLLI